MADGVHPSKCEHLQFTNKHNFIDTTLHIIWPHHHNKSLVLYKYLGFTIDCHLSWKNHISTITAKANAAKAFLRRNTTFCPTEVKIHCYKTFVRQLWNIQLLSGHHTPHMICLNLSQFCADLLDMFLMIIRHSIVFLPCLTN